MDKNLQNKKIQINYRENILSCKKKPSVGILGIIGAGKSFFAEALAKCLDVPLFPEPLEENYLLKLFYENMLKYSFEMQVLLLVRRLNIYRKCNIGLEGGVCDRTIFEDSIFAQVLNNDGLMRDDQLKVYLELYTSMMNDVKPLNFMIYLRVSPEEALKRIKTRGRESEKGITIDYMKKLYNEYERFVVETSKVSNIIVLDWESLYNVNDTAEIVAQYLNGKLTKKPTIMLDNESLSLHEIKGSSPVELTETVLGQPTTPKIDSLSTLSPEF
jgi:deoxyadenosine/deoxycytidine kinase